MRSSPTTPSALVQLPRDGPSPNRAAHCPPQNPKLNPNPELGPNPKLCLNPKLYPVCPFKNALNRGIKFSLTASGPFIDPSMRFSDAVPSGLGSANSGINFDE